MRREARTGETFVYLITEGEYCKVGVAKDPKRRLHAIQNGNPRKLELVAYWSFPAAAEAYRMERNALNWFGCKSARGEWFHLPAEAMLPDMKRLMEYQMPRRINLAIPTGDDLPNWDALRVA